MIFTLKLTKFSLFHHFKHKIGLVYIKNNHLFNSIHGGNFHNYLEILLHSITFCLDEHNYTSNCYNSTLTSSYILVFQLRVPPPGITFSKGRNSVPFHFKNDMVKRNKSLTCIQLWTNYKLFLQFPVWKKYILIVSPFIHFEPFWLLLYNFEPFFINFLKTIFNYFKRLSKAIFIIIFKQTNNFHTYKYINHYQSFSVTILTTACCTI